MPTFHRFFVALLPPQEVQEYANEIKQDFADRYHSQAAQKSPPHITLQPPFEWAESEVSKLEQRLSQFAACQSPIPVTLDGYAAFAPRVIFINVQPTAELLRVQTNLMRCLEETLGIIDPTAKSRPFVPHMTVAFRDLTIENFKLAWQEFQGRSLHANFLVSHLTLLRHDETRWQIDQDFSFEHSIKNQVAKDEGIKST